MISWAAGLPPFYKPPFERCQAEALLLPVRGPLVAVLQAIQLGLPAIALLSIGWCPWNEQNSMWASWVADSFPVRNISNSLIKRKKKIHLGLLWVFWWHFLIIFHFSGQYQFTLDAIQETQSVVLTEQNTTLPWPILSKYLDLVQQWRGEGGGGR